MQEIAETLIVFSVPLAAIVGSFVYKYKKLQLEQGKSGAVEDKRVQALEAANADLRARIETLETIVTSSDHRNTGRAQAQALDDLEQQAAAQVAEQVGRSAHR